jgi:hypothetical protein
MEKVEWSYNFFNRKLKFNLTIVKKRLNHHKTDECATELKLQKFFLARHVDGFYYTLCIRCFLLNM